MWNGLDFTPMGDSSVFLSGSHLLVYGTSLNRFFNEMDWISFRLEWYRLLDWFDSVFKRITIIVYTCKSDVVCHAKRWVMVTWANWIKQRQPAVLDSMFLLFCGRDHRFRLLLTACFLMNPCGAYLCLIHSHSYCSRPAPPFIQFITNFVFSWVLVRWITIE